MDNYEMRSFRMRSIQVPEVRADQQRAFIGYHCKFNQITRFDFTKLQYLENFCGRNNGCWCEEYKGSSMFGLTQLVSLNSLRRLRTR
ncbi:unnamed protein product [Lactuca virosa]|uniref:Uncharacterized protein n=1 Tax=Lactuca virosa TaxID=75947 RepID=A0AAU9NBM3_9ASTR|nr:unnamed protein product [Lactuca virosa]